jgi:hypothetical protein
MRHGPGPARPPRSVEFGAPAVCHTRDLKLGWDSRRADGVGAVVDLLTKSSRADQGDAVQRLPIEATVNKLTGHGHRGMRSRTRKMSVPMLSLEEHPVDEVAEPVLVVSLRAGLVERASAVPQRTTPRAAPQGLRAEPGNDVRYVLLPHVIQTGECPRTGVAHRRVDHRAAP